MVPFEQAQFTSSETTLLTASYSVASNITTSSAVSEYTGDVMTTLVADDELWKGDG